MTYSYADYLYKDEAECVQSLLDYLPWDDVRAQAVKKTAIDLVNHIRSAKRGGDLEAFLQQYSLNTEQGLAMMCLAEALLRIPDARTANALIRDKMAAAEWVQSRGGSQTLMTRAAGIGMKLTRATLDSALSKIGEPVIREAMIKAMGMMARQFVLGDTVENAVKNAIPYEKKGYRLSYDVLGEGARDAATAERYYNSYSEAIDYIGKNAKTGKRKPGISVKLSALHPRYSYAQREKSVPAITQMLHELSLKAAQYDMTLTVDAEEVARLDISIDIMEGVMKKGGFSGWEGFGLAVQAYSKRALPLLDRLAEMAEGHRQKLQVRIVKGAYWDTEVKLAQMKGMPDYPLFTRKVNSDVSFLACAAKLFENKDLFYPMLATHNAHSVAAIVHMAREHNATFEMQKLFGMGDGLYDHVIEQGLADVCIYAPIGPHHDLLPYLVRRLLENGANSSFVNQILDKNIPAEKIVSDPVKDADAHPTKRHSSIPLPANIFNNRKNSAGVDLDAPQYAQKLLQKVESFKSDFPAQSIIDGAYLKDRPSDTQVNAAFDVAQKAFGDWSRTPAEERAKSLEKFADLIEKHRDELIAILVHEGGKTIPDSLSELREAVDFCRYYAAQGRKDFSADGELMRGYTGESNRLTLEGRGVFVCISPWNFPLAIFTGQVVAALMAGNSVLAKPASNTPYIAMRTVELMHQAGIPVNVLHLLVGSGKMGGKMVQHKHVAGVVFTGSTQVAKSINLSLAESDGPIAPLIAETGGQNAMIVDSSALLEQVVDDVFMSAFNSAGQRCSALRVLFVQEEVADNLIGLLRGAMAEMVVGKPQYLSTDLGPVIDAKSLKELQDHQAYLEKVGKKIAQVPLGKDLKGHYFAPCAYEIPNMEVLKGEVFGPILHVIRYKSNALDDVIAQINGTGFGLTCGVHSRIQSTQDYIASKVRAGNIYVNRSMIGAVVGVQPFGGMGLSGTGPKAGGPHYLHRFATEKHVSVNTTAAGGNTTLVSLKE